MVANLSKPMQPPRVSSLHELTLMADYRIGVQFNATIQVSQHRERDDKDERDTVRTIP